ncbi:Glycosyl hydrolases family 43 [Parafrankia irregularis]|uniref:Glycosyl hydrolases family 43 n=1 Tax=Parafrankia irregularis TaxID=795642 RepID=A0A0S4QIY1_9ACTN|nr:Glycosyl hydrolases family 43 [Parafrankia irregularis]
MPVSARPDPCPDPAATDSFAFGSATETPAETAVSAGVSVARRPWWRVRRATVIIGSLVVLMVVVAALAITGSGVKGVFAAASSPQAGSPQAGAAPTDDGQGQGPSGSSSGSTEVEPPAGTPTPGDPAQPRSAVVVRGSNLADPYLLTIDGVTYAYGTNADGAHVPVLTSTDPSLRSWVRAGDALPHLPGWAQDTGFTTWAPSVAEVDGGYVLYYVTRVAATGHQCVSTAHATSPTGPFIDVSTSPAICQEAEGGSIDPSPYAVGAERYLTWKSEGILPGTTPTIWAQRLAADGRTLLGEPTALLRPTLDWQHGLVEGPAMLVRGGSYDLLFSAGDWHSPDYATGSATCAGPLGPCTVRPESLLRTGTAGVGPGGAEPFRSIDRASGEETWWLAFHTWNRREPAENPHADRQLVVVPLPDAGALTPADRSAVRLGRVTTAP